MCINKEKLYDYPKFLLKQTRQTGESAIFHALFGHSKFYYKTTFWPIQYKLSKRQEELLSYPFPKNNIPVPNAKQTKWHESKL